MKVRLRSSMDTGVPSSADTQTEKEYTLIKTYKYFQVSVSVSSQNTLTKFDTR